MVRFTTQTLALLVLTATTLGEPRLATSPYEGAQVAAGLPTSNGPLACGQVDLTHSTDPNTVDDGLACFNFAGCTLESEAARSFDLSAGLTADRAHHVLCVQYGVSDVLDTSTGFSPVTVNLYIDTNGGAPDLASLVPIPGGSITDLVPSGTLNQVRVVDFSANNVLVPANATLVVGVASPDLCALRGAGHHVFGGYNHAGQTAPSYLRSPSCGPSDFVDLATVGFSGHSMVLAVDLDPVATRLSASQKGSLLMYSKVELRWSAGSSGALRQDTILELTNDYPDDVCVQLYFVNGDEPLDPVLDPVTGGLIVEGEPGWEWVDCQFCLTPDQTTYWSAATGLPAGCQPFTILDPSTGMGPGRPDPTVPGERHLRGFIYAWAVDQQGHSISWNHLSGGATLVNYLNSDAWDYNAWAFQANQNCTRECQEPDRCEDPVVTCILAAHGERIGEPGRIRMNGSEFDSGYDMLLMDFLASGSTALSSGGTVATLDTDLTLHPITADLRQDSIGPITTKAEFAIWNEDERRFSGTTRCITCWDQTLLSLYGNPNHFLLANLQADKGKARIDGVESIVCDLNCVRNQYNHGSLDIDFIFDILGIDHVCSYDASLLGVVAKHLAFSGAAGGRATAGRNLVGMGTEDGWIKWDIVPPPGTAQDGADGLRSDRKIVKSPSARPSSLDAALPVDAVEIPGD